MSQKATPSAVQGCIAIFDGHKPLKMEESENRTFPIPSRKSPRMGFCDTLIEWIERNRDNKLNCTTTPSGRWFDILLTMAVQAHSPLKDEEKVLKGDSRSAADVDQELVKRVQQGDKKAFDLLVLKYQHKIIPLITRYIKDPSEALDVAQETFIKAYRALPNFRGDSAFYTWLYRIAINTAKNHIAARARRPSDSEIELDTAEQFETAVRLKDQETPEGILLSEEVAEAVRQAIEELPDELRTAITLREFEGLSYEEIAQAMNCPVGTVRSRIFRAREAIDKKLRTLRAGMRKEKKKPLPEKSSEKS